MKQETTGGHLTWYSRMMLNPPRHLPGPLGVLGGPGLTQRWLSPGCTVEHCCSSPSSEQATNGSMEIGRAREEEKINAL